MTLTNYDTDYCRYDAVDKIPAILSTVPDPDLSFVVILSCTGKKETVSIVKPQFARILTGSFTFRCVCVCDVPIAPRIESTAANKVR